MLTKGSEEITERLGDKVLLEVGAVRAPIPLRLEAQETRAHEFTDHVLLPSIRFGRTLLGPSMK